MAGPLSITALAPVILQSVDSYHERLETEKEAYAITDEIGFDTASFIITGPLEYLAAWFESGLVRDIVWRDPEGGTCWNGYVNRLALTVGGNTRTKSIDGMANRIQYVYTPLDTTQDPPTAGAQTTITVNDTDSQGKYGVKVKTISGNEATVATAADEAATWLKILSTIKIGETVAIGAGKMPSLKVEMRGYAHAVDWYYYARTQVTGTDDAHAIIIAVLIDDPNAIVFSSDISIDTNATQIEKYHDGKQTGWKIIQSIAMRGYESAGTGERWTCGVYEGRRVMYKAAEGLDSNLNPLSSNQHLTLTRQITDAGDVILDQADREIMPWRMRPDRLLYTAGIPGLPMYVKQVKFTAPNRLSLSGEDALNPLAKPPPRIMDAEEIDRLRSWFFSRDRDVTLIDGRTIAGSGTTPVGGIILWSGSVASIPTGWALCDGNNGTPNLQDRFVVGAGSGYAVGATGGAATHAHGNGSLATDNDTHDHDVDSGTTTSESAHTHSFADTSDGPSAEILVPEDNHVHYVTSGVTGTTDAHTHGPGTLLTATSSPIQHAAHHAHTHSVGGTSGTGSAHSHGPGTLNTDSDTHSHDVTGSTASGSSLPPYYALAYIMRTS